MQQVYKAGLIGFGYWGPILLRNFQANPRFDVTMVIDRHPEKQAAITAIAPRCTLSGDLGELLTSDVDLVIIATQADTHAGLIRQALEAGKHVFVEKPFALSVAEAEALCDYAERVGKKIWVDHTFLFNPAYAAVKAALHNGMIGRVWRFHSTRAAYGLFQHDANVIWHLMYHDLYLLTDLFGMPNRVTANGQSHIIKGVEDEAIASLFYDNGVHATVLCDMTFPEKKREIVITGEAGSLVWNEAAVEKLVLFKHNVVADLATGKLTYNHPGAPQILPVKKEETLALEVSAFVAYLDGQPAGLCDGRSALKTIQVVADVDAAMRKI